MNKYKLCSATFDLFKSSNQILYDEIENIFYHTSDDIVLCICINGLKHYKIISNKDLTTYFLDMNGNKINISNINNVRKVQLIPMFCTVENVQTKWICYNNYLIPNSNRSNYYLLLDGTNQYYPISKTIFNALFAKI